ncbi:hypothetical protein PN36_25250 [Candidatus Thiomargarita nelsonii]|uniref:Outer membrane protein assembly factor BamB n=1 Tax=Candidatus Thiomargarita nelsonii TaxID=1003181 RepID=A0A4E0QNH6_9GAMM|nr:hypothetical protein PN36_25250 [Candidatus Thiomargarita nelsonii]
MHKAILLLYLLITLSGCSLFNETDNTAPPAPLVDFKATLTLKTLWTADAGGNIEKGYLKIAPAFHEGRLFTASQKGIVRAFNFKNGKIVWEQKIDVPISGGPGIGDGLVVLGSQKGEVVALSKKNGHKQWQAQVSSEVLAKPRISRGIVVVRTIDGKLFGLNSQNGARLWVYEPSRTPLLTLRGTSTPVIKHDQIIAGFDNGQIALLELQTGKVLWEAPVAVPRGSTELERMVDIDADPLLVDDTIYVTSYHGRTVAIDLLQAKLLWEKPLSSYAGLGVDLDNLYVSDTKSHIWALERSTGEKWWKQEKLEARNITAPVNIGNYVVVGDLEGYLHWMRRKDGQFVARYRMGKASIFVPPLVVHDILVAYDSQGEIVALRPR